MNAPIAIPLAGCTAFEAAVLAAAKLAGVAGGQNAALIEALRRETLAAFERLAEAGIDSAWLRWRITYLHDDLMWRAYWAMEGAELFQRLGELLALDEALDAPPALAAVPAAPESRPETPPPPSGEGDEEAVELSAALAATGDTLPPESGPRELGEMACCAGSDTDRAAPGDGWLWGEIPPVEI